jgi:hypothetical protein
VITLTTDSIKDFQTCELLYSYRYREELSEKLYSRDLVSQKFESTIKNIIHFFWFKKQGGISPSYASLLNRWEKLWFPKGTDLYDITINQHESHYGNAASLTTKAAGILLKLYETYSEADITPIGIAENFTAVLDKDIKIEDRFDLIYRKGKQNYVVKFLFNHKSKTNYMYQVDFTTMYLGFKLHHPSQLHQTRFGYIDLMSNNFDFIEYEISEEDVESLYFWCTSIADKQVFVPRRGLTSHCKKCHFDASCSKWKFPTTPVAIKK